MGGQACVFYGAAEFSRDTDFAVLADERTGGSLVTSAFGSPPRQFRVDDEF
jgi:hypothetical protein